MNLGIDGLVKLFGRSEDDITRLQHYGRLPSPRQVDGRAVWDTSDPRLKAAFRTEWGADPTQEDVASAAECDGMNVERQQRIAAARKAMDDAYLKAKANPGDQRVVGWWVIKKREYMDLAGG